MPPAHAGDSLRIACVAPGASIWQVSRGMRCPICKQPADMSKKNRFRPFCCERCHLVDLGTWASGEYRVAGGKVDDKEHPDDRRKSKIVH
jgi:endogenous inhibitor of DNA gyrase (YacG/DUF329 family)